jgi:hypothetical protein
MRGSCIHSHHSILERLYIMAERFSTVTVDLLKTCRAKSCFELSAFLTKINLVINLPSYCEQWMAEWSKE